jgi:hypothetical protein
MVLVNTVTSPRVPCKAGYNMISSVLKKDSETELVTLSDAR